MGKTYKGVDVSGFQGKIDWVRAKAAGVEFAILKAIRKDLSPDKQFENNWSGCFSADIPIQGVYNYTYATTVQKAVNDAHAVLDILGSDRHPFVWLDWEDKCLPGGKLAAEIINAYGDVITAGGCDFGLYFGMAFYDNTLRAVMEHVRPQYRKGWEARYYRGYNAMRIMDQVDGEKKPAGFRGDLYGWQYSSSGRVDGISGNVDLDMWYVDVEAAGVAPEVEAGYQLADFIRESRGIWGVSPVDSANEILKKTITVSTSENRSHSIVTPLERYMQVLGYYAGSIEADHGKAPVYGNGMKKAIILYQTHVVQSSNKYRDGELTSGAATWKTLYGA